MRIAHVASEVAPYSQTGGLAQVAAALPSALVGLAPEAPQVAVFSPLYAAVLESVQRRGETLGPRHSEVSVRVGEREHRVAFRSLRREEGLTLHFIDCPELFGRSELYGDENGDYADNGERFGVLCRAVLQGAAQAMDGAPDVYHCHDWQTGLLPALLKSYPPEVRPKTVFTIHNLAYQGWFPKELLPALGIPWSTFTPQGLEFYDQVSMLKAGVAFSDATTTVSESYAHEIRTPEFGCYLDGFLRADCPRLLGIRNGIDVDEWNPATDKTIAESYSARSLRGKTRCREALLEEYGLSASGELLIGIVSRLADQKGLDLVAEIAPELQSLGARLVLVGNGDPALEGRFRWLSEQFRDSISVFVGFDAARAHRVFAGADAFLMPSRFEPCGLGQMAAMRYGTLPIVHAVGGLRDTVIDVDEGPDRANGFRFEHASVDEVRRTISRAASLRRKHPEVWKQLILRGMTEDWSWAKPARQYLRLYGEL